MTSNGRIYLGPSVTMEDKAIILALITLAKISLNMLWLKLLLACNITTLIIINLLTRSQIQQSTMLLSLDSWDSQACRVTWKKKLRKPPDKAKTNNNQKSSIFWMTLPIGFFLIGMNIEIGIFNSEREILTDNFGK